jgi:hypothetical protein
MQVGRRVLGWPCNGENSVYGRLERNERIGSIRLSTPLLMLENRLISSLRPVRRHKYRPTIKLCPPRRFATDNSFREFTALRQVSNRQRMGS